MDASNNSLYLWSPNHYADKSPPECTSEFSSGAAARGHHFFIEARLPASSKTLRGISRWHCNGSTLLPGIDSVARNGARTRCEGPEYLRRLEKTDMHGARDRTLGWAPESPSHANTSRCQHIPGIPLSHTTPYQRLRFS